MVQARAAGKLAPNQKPQKKRPGRNRALKVLGEDA